MFTASRECAFFDYFRVPYDVADVPSPPLASNLPTGHPLLAPASLTVAENPAAARLYWLPARPSPPPRASAGRYLLDGAIPIFGTVASDVVLAELLQRAGWHRLFEILTASHDRYASVWRHPDGSVLLPFDPAEMIENCWSERYRSIGTRGVVSTGLGLARRGYYRLRPYLPRSLQIRLRQLFSGLQQRATFPAWPVERALHDLYGLLFDLVASVAGEQVPYVSLWPYGHQWALVLTHDVETAVGYEHLHLLRDLEASMGLRSSWNFVPRRYDTDERVVRDLQGAGFEVGVHGLVHDGHDLGNLRTFRQRLPEIHRHASRWGAVGFRSPALHRVWEWMPELAFDYDSSYPDTDPYQPLPGGCCSVLPYHNGSLVELPITLAQDFVMFDLLQNRDEALWLEKVEYVRRCGGMALVLTHPDYMLERPRLEAYERFLAAVRDDPVVWKALPAEVAAWWRRRSVSCVQWQDGRYQVAGPAEGAHVAFAGDPSAVHARLGRGRTPEVIP